MPAITINIPGGVTARVLDAIAMNNGWDAASGITKGDFAKNWMIQQIKQQVQIYEGNIARAAAEAAAAASVSTDIVLT